MKRWSILTIIMVMAMILAACGPSSTPAPTAVPQQQAPTEAPKATEAPAATTAPAATEAPAATTAPTTGAASDSGAGGSEAGARAAGLTELADAYAGKMKGTKVTMTGPFTDEDAVKFNNSMKAFSEATGIDIQYDGSKEFEGSHHLAGRRPAPPPTSSTSRSPACSAPSSSRARSCPRPRWCPKTG